MGRDEAEVLGERALPQNGAVVAERVNGAADRVDKDVARRRVRDRGGPAHAVRRYVAQVDVHPTLPQELARLDIETHDALLQVRALSSRVLQIEVVAENDGRRAAAMRNPPGEIIAIARPARRKAGLRGMAVSARPPPIRPIFNGWDGWAR